MPDELKAESLDLSSLQIHRDDNAPRGSKTGLVVGLLILLMVLGAGGWFLLGGKSRLPVVQVDLVRRVGAGASGAILSAGGYILPDRKADVSSRVFGRLEWIGVEAGSMVKKDDVIARLANADAAARVVEMKATLADAAREYDRMKRVVEDGVEPRASLDRAETIQKLAKARLDTAEADFEYTLIRAPFDGIVVRRNAQAGETVGPSTGTGSASAGAAVCTLVDRSSLEMVADVNETNIGKVKQGQKVEVTIDALPDRKYRGEVRQIIPTADRQKGIVQVKVKVADLDEDVYPEMAARAAFLRVGAAAPGAKRVIAPKGSVRQVNGKKIVLIVDSGRVRATEVETGAEGEDGTEILRGLEGGEQAVTGGDAVSDGQAIKVSDGK
ncbi:MAG TPA: efflux RND transporter periplasmic adaptor subunit [Planctomycetota bacterium]|nr:efflux RND transporter periplasmic adaptor subunit [Planctomycetota bacterium]